MTDSTEINAENRCRLSASIFDADLVFGADFWCQKQTWQIENIMQTILLLFVLLLLLHKKESNENVKEQYGYNRGSITDLRTELTTHLS